MTDKRRAWFQIHLSTALLAILAAGSILGANMHKHWELILSQGGDSYGWPVALYFEAGSYTGYAWRFEPLALVINVVYWISLLVILVFLCEWRHRRHAKIHPFLELHWITHLAFALILGWILWENLRWRSERPRGWPTCLYEWTVYDRSWRETNFSHAASNVATGVIILFGVGWFCEWLIHHIQILFEKA